MLLRCLLEGSHFTHWWSYNRTCLHSMQNIKGQHSLNSMKSTITCVHQLLWLVNIQGETILPTNINGVFVLINKKALIIKALSTASLLNKFWWWHQNLYTPKIHGFKVLLQKGNWSFIFRVEWGYTLEISITAHPQTSAALKVYCFIIHQTFCKHSSVRHWERKRSMTWSWSQMSYG